MRIRPLNPKELSFSDFECVTVDKFNNLTLLDPGTEFNRNDVALFININICVQIFRKKQIQEMTFNFDNTFNKYVDTRQIY